MSQAASTIYVLIYLVVILFKISLVFVVVVKQFVIFLRVCVWVWVGRQFSVLFSLKKIRQTASE